MRDLSGAHLLAAVFAGGAIALIAWRARALSGSGAFAAATVGFVHFGFGSWLGAAALLAFFVSSSLLSRLRAKQKAALGFAKGAARDAGQVVANGGVAAAFFLLAALLSEARFPLLIAALGALAAANADTWATEIGAAFGGRPVRITDGRPAETGESGAVSLPGTVAALLGALLIAVVGALLGAGVGSLFAVTAGGVFGCLVDSLLGATLQAEWRSHESGRWVETPAAPGEPPARGLAWLGNDLVNLAATLAGAVMAGLIAWLAA